MAGLTIGVAPWRQGQRPPGHHRVQSLPEGAQLKNNEKKRDGNHGTKWGPKQLTETKSGNSVEALCAMRH